MRTEITMFLMAVIGLLSIICSGILLDKINWENSFLTQPLFYVAIITLIGGFFLLWNVCLGLTTASGWKNDRCKLQV